MRCALFLMLAIAFLSLETYAASGCNGLTMQSGSSVNFSSNAAQQLTVNVRRNNTSNGCDYFIAFSRGSSSNYNRSMIKGADAASYQLYRSYPYADVLKDFSDAVSNADVIAGSFPDKAGSTQNIESYRAVLGDVSYIPVGLYSDTVTVRLYEGTLNSNTLRSTTTVNFQYSSTRSIDLSLVSSGAAFNANATSMAFDFGTMYAGESKAFDIMVQTNAGYSLSMSSQNGGKMKHVILSGNSVPYSMSVHGRDVTLASGPTTVATGSGTSPAGGSRIPVGLSIGAIANSASGDYSDAITVTVQTTE